MAKHRIEVKKEDLPKDRNLGVVACILRGNKGPMKDLKKEADKNACREKIKDQD